MFQNTCTHNTTTLRCHLYTLQNTCTNDTLTLSWCDGWSRPTVMYHNICY